MTPILVHGRCEVERFRRLLKILGLPDDLAYALADWIDADNEEQPVLGAEDEYYLSLQPPYVTANRPLTDVGELARVRGFSDDIRARLKPFVSALPASTAVNANTAPPEVLSAVIEGLDLDGARALVAQRERAFFRDYADIANRLPSGATITESDLRTSSNYFLARVRVTIGGAEARGLALLLRPEIGWPAIVWRKYQ